MTQQHDNIGVLFRNDKAGDEKAPDYKGNVTVAGVEYWLKAWINEAKNGSKYMRLRLRPKAEAARPKPDIDDSIPF